MEFILAEIESFCCILYEFWLRFMLCIKIVICAKLVANGMFSYWNWNWKHGTSKKFD